MSDELFDNELHLAVRVSDVEATRAALKAGFDPNKIGLFEWSAVHEAAFNGDFGLLETLIEYGGNCNEKDQLNGSTALHYAASEGHPQCLELLLSKGGDASVENDKGQTPPQITRHKGCKQLFTKFGIDVTTTVHFEEQPCSQGLKFMVKEEAESKHLLPSNSVTIESQSGISSASSESGIGSSLKIQSWRAKLEALSSASEAVSSCKSVSPFGSLTSISSSIASRDDCAGYISMAFQYNSKTSRLKICITQIILTCLSPPQKNKKDSAVVLYVAGKIFNPNEGKIKNARSSIRARSDCIKLHANGDQENPVREGDGSVETFWSGPNAYLNFKSFLSLEFLKITKDLVNGHDIEVSLNMRQKKSLLKHSDQGLPFATLQMPLKQAVKNLVRETYELQAGPIPETTSKGHLNLALSEIVVDSTSVKSDSALQGRWNVSFQLDGAERSASDGDLQLVDVQNTSKSISSSFYNVDKIGGENSDSLTEVRSHSTPASPQVRVRVLSEDDRNPVCTETKVNIPIDETKGSSGSYRTFHERAKRLGNAFVRTTIKTDEEMGSQENVQVNAILPQVVYEKSETSPRTRRYRKEELRTA